MSSMNMYARLIFFGLTVVCTGCSAVAGSGPAPQRKNLVCVDDAGCRNSLAKDCPKGTQLHGVVPAIIVQYSCNPE